MNINKAENRKLNFVKLKIFPYDIYQSMKTPDNCQMIPWNINTDGDQQIWLFLGLSNQMQGDGA